MNYILEINAFERRMKRQPLPPAAQLLWYKLMHFANTLHWPEKFAIDNDRLTLLLGSGSDQTVRKARQQLLDAGLIIYEKGVKGKPGNYKLVSIAAIEHDQKQDDGYEGLADLAEIDDITAYFGYTEALGLEVKRFTVELFEKYLPGVRPNDQDISKVFHYIRENEGEGPGSVMTFPRERKELLAYAFEQASKTGPQATNWRYIEGIYGKFAQRGIKTVEDAYEDQAQHDRRKGRY